MGEDSVFTKANQAKEEVNIAKAREKLELVLVTDATIEKHTNSQYNQDDFLNEMILNKILGAEIVDDIVIIEDYAFSIDRSVPKIGQYIGKKDELIFPELVVSKPVVAIDNKTANFTITAKEKENGITKIEILQEGHVIKSYEYDNEKSEINETYTAKQNGKYVVRVYAKYSISKIVEVEGIILLVDFKPNGDETYKKEHSTKIVSDKTNEKVISMKYQWTNTTVEPEEETFQDICESGDTITKNGLTGTYYLWILLRTESGKTSIWRSEKFNFDNAEPIATLTATPVSYSSFTLKVEAQDKESGIVKYEFYVDGEKKETKEIAEIKENNEQTLTVNNIAYGSHNCYVIVTDKLGHTTRKDIVAKTLLDTTAPTITSFTATKYSATGITLSATAKDTGTGIVKFEFYIDNVLKDTQTCSATTSSVTKSKVITGLSTGNHSCMVKVYDAKSNNNKNTKSGATKLYYWKKWSSDPVKEYKEKRSEPYKYSASSTNCYTCSSWSIDKSIGKIHHYSFSKAMVDFGTNVLIRTSASSEGYSLSERVSTGRMEYNSSYKAYEGMVCDVTVEEVISKYNKGSQYYGEISGTSSNLHPKNAGDATGYYEYIGIK